MRELFGKIRDFRKMWKQQEMEWANWNGVESEAPVTGDDDRYTSASVPSPTEAKTPSPSPAESVPNKVLHDQLQSLGLTEDQLTPEQQRELNELLSGIEEFNDHPKKKSASMPKYHLQ